MNCSEQTAQVMQIQTINFSPHLAEDAAVRHCRADHSVFSPITTHIGFLERAGALRPASTTAGLEGHDPCAQTVLLLLRQLTDLRAPPRSMAIHVTAAELTALSPAVLAGDQQLQSNSTVAST